MSFPIRVAASILALAGLIATPCAAQYFGSGDSDDYRTLRSKGAYREALDALNEALEPYQPRIPFRLYEERAGLYFEVGEVDKAIEDMESLTDVIPDPSYLLRLAELYRYRGRQKEYHEVLDQAVARRPGTWRYSSDLDNSVAIGRIAELKGEDPKYIFSTYYKIIMDRAPHYVPTYVAAGDLAYRKGEYNLASRYYGEALDRDSENQDALAGLAECYWKSGDDRLDETQKKLLELNPNHPRANAIEVGLLLDLGETNDALKTIGRMLRINPNRQRFRALKAAALFLADDLEAMERIQEETLAFNPMCSEVFRVPGRVASRHYRFKEGAAFQRRALEADPEDHAARQLYAFDLLRLGDEPRGREEFEKVFEADPFSVQAYNMLQALDTLATFATIERGPFVLQLPAREAPIFGEDALTLLLEAAELLQKKYDITIAAPVDVQIFDNHDDFIVRSVGLPGSTGHLGICFGRVVTMDSPTARPKGSVNWRSVLWHEFTHVITLQKTKNRMPRWLSEGISVYEETERDPAWGQRMKEDYRPLVSQGDLPGVSALEAFFTRPATPQHLSFGYFLAGEFVIFYVGEYEFPALRSALGRIGRGELALDALSASAGVSRRKLDRAFKAYLERRLEPYENLPGPLVGSKTTEDGGPAVPLLSQPLIERMRGTPPFLEAMTAGAAALREERWEEAERELKRARALFPEYMGEDGPLPLLVQLYERQERNKELDEALRGLLYLDPANLGVCERLVSLHQEAGAWPRVLEVGRLAMGIDPFDVPMRKALCEAQVKTGDHAGALETLACLIHLDSARATDYRMRRVESLARLERWDSAKREVIEILEVMPHYWEAQELLLSILERNDGVRTDG